MKTCSKCKETKPLECFSKNRDRKDGLQGWCKGCLKARYAANPEKDKARSAVWHAANIEKEKARSAARYATNPEVFKARAAARARANPEETRGRVNSWKKANRERVRTLSKEWYRANSEKLRARRAEQYRTNTEKHSAKNKKWTKANPGKVNAKTRRRQASRLQATPGWANEFFMQEAYALAALRTKMLGFKWHVDHVVPLRSKIVCGLHCEANLRVIPAAINMSKGNRYWPDMP